MSKIDFQKELNAEQYEVVSSGDGPASRQGGPHLVLAGAGSGKTRTLVYRVAYLIQHGVMPSKILLLTFTNKAANEMMHRVRQLLGWPADKKMPLWGGTFHSTANKLLRIYGDKIGLAKNFTIMDEDDAKSLIKNISKQILASRSGFSGIAAKRQPSPSIIKETISFAINSDISLGDSLETKFIEWLPLLETFEKIADEYKERKTKSNLVDFDDLLIFWKRLTLHPDTAKLLQEKWDYILVDEYQDTNTIQAEIIYNLAQKHKNILVVGDDAQSIYSFRAADIKNILEFPQKFPGCRVHKLETNYRSTPEILRLANQVISQNIGQFKKDLRAIKDGFVRPELTAVSTNLEEASLIARRIQQMIADGLEPREIAVLFRASHHSQNLELELNRRNIAYEMRGGLKFFERAHIKDVLAYLRILHNVYDQVSWQRILEIYEGIGPASAQKIIAEIEKLGAPGKLVAGNISLSSRATAGWDNLNVLIQKMIDKKKDNPGKLANMILEHYDDYLKEKFTDYRQRQDDLEQLATFASTYDDLEQFLAEVTLQENFSIEEDKDNKNRVVLSTIHQAKGLEWPVVFVLNLSNQAFPHPLAKSDEEKEEERRLFYVAITRAQSTLVMTYPMAMFKYDGYQNIKPSEFISSVDSHLLQLNELARTLTYADQDTQYERDPDGDGGSFLPDVNDW